MNVFLFTAYFYVILISIIGYGFLLKYIFNIDYVKNDDFHYIGFLGFLSITLISYLSIFLIKHDFIHNSIMHIIGTIFGIYFLFKNKNKNYILILFIISIFFISSIFLSKPNEDFGYYHLPFTKYLTENKIILGLTHLNHGYNLVSSIFYLNSTFYLPFIKLFNFHFIYLYSLIFFNFYFFKKIFNKKLNKNNLVFLYLIILFFFNLSFNRLAEFGTDKIGQLLIVIIVLDFFEKYFNENKKDILDSFYSFFVLMIIYCISLKIYFITYFLLLLLLLNKNNFLQFFNFFKNKLIFLSIFFLFTFFLHNFLINGCLIPMIYQTCMGEKLLWGRNIDDLKQLSLWLEFWAKAGAGPGFQMPDQKNYIINFNWIGNWYKKYFLIKALDQIGIYIFSIILCFICLYKKNFFFTKIDFKEKKKYLYFLIILFLIFYIWLIKHPTLRYGGYSTLILLFTFLLYFSLVNNFNNNFKLNFKKIIIVFLIVVVIFNIRNFHRIQKEFLRDDYFKFVNFPFYSFVSADYKNIKLDSNFTLYYSVESQCWFSPTPCSHGEKNLKLTKKMNFYILYK